LLGVEILCFFGMYWAGSNGLRSVWHARSMNIIKEQELLVLKNEVEDLKRQLHQWETEPFYKEKVAREQLQMARAGDMIYYT
jgi:cell division protein FtsB